MAHISSLDTASEAGQQASRVHLLPLLQAQQAQFALRQSPSEAVPASPPPLELGNNDSLPPPNVTVATQPAAPHIAAADSSPPPQQQELQSVAPAHTLGPERCGLAAMDIDGGGAAELAPGGQCAAPGVTLREDRQREQLQELPAHHPSRWQAAEGECALCHAGAEAGPLGWLVSDPLGGLEGSCAASCMEPASSSTASPAELLHSLGFCDPWGAPCSSICVVG